MEIDRLPDRQPLKTTLRNADHAKRCPVETDRLTHDARVTREAPRPIGIAQDGDRSTVERLVIVDVDHASGARPYAKDPEPVARNDLSHCGLRLVAGGRVHPRGRRHGREPLRIRHHALKTLESRIRDEVFALVAVGTLEGVKLVGSLDRQRLPHERIEDRPDCGIGSNP